MARLAKLFGRGEAPPRVDRIVVGLGNPGEGYATARHHVGFQAASRRRIRPRRSASSSSTSSRRSRPTSGRRRRPRSRVRRRPSRWLCATGSPGRWNSSMAEVERGIAPLEPPAVAGARLGGILALLERSDPYQDLAARLEDRRAVDLTDATAGARAFAWSALVAQGGRTLPLIAP